jgi:hexosaminidase
VADRAYRLANAGYQVVLSHGTHLYLDHPNEVAAEERGYYWASRFTDAQKIFGYMPDHLYANADKTLAGEAITNLETLLGRALPKLDQPQNILGMQGQVWSETIRTAEQLEQMVYPRLLPIAERAWHQASWEGDVVDQKRRDADYQAFAQTMTLKELPKLAQAGVSFYLPPPGAIIKDGLLTANSAYPGLPIEYSLDQGKSWVRYSEATKINSHGIHQAKVWLRTTLPSSNSKPAMHSRVVYSN